MRRAVRVPGGLARAAWAAAAAWALCAAVPGAAQAQPKETGSGIYTCVDDKGRRITSDRPIPECLAREQRQLNRDGSLQRTVPPTPTAEERAEQEQRERRAAEALALQADAMRQDRTLLQRYKTPEEHRRARVASLDALRSAMAATDQRLADLTRERRQLLQEAEFYRGRTLPTKLQQSIEAVDTAMAAQRAATQHQRTELDRINRLYDVELERLRQLWAGAAPGSMGPIAPVRAASGAASGAASALEPARAGAPAPAAAAATPPATAPATAARKP